MIETDVEGFTLLDPPQLEELVVVAQVVQRSGRTFSSQATRKLNTANGMEYHSRQYGRALEYLKVAEGISNDNHSSRIFDDGSVQYEINGSWEEVGNLFDWLE